LTPVYYTDAGLTQVYISGDTDAVYPNWAANGYRLPMEAECQKAARGGLNGLRFPWGNTIDWNHANYYSQWTSGAPTYSYDLAFTSGYDPAFTNGETAYTSPVGYFAPNGYGLYDMAGNVQVWCWDWYAGPPYPTGSPYLGGTDPRGPASSPDGYRVLHGGFFTYGLRCAKRSTDSPSFLINHNGLRCVRGQLQMQLQVTTTSLPNGTNGVAYSQTLVATGGQTPYSWTNISGVLPPGLTLATNGLISGTPTTSGTSNFTVRVTDALSATATQPLTLTVVGLPSIPFTFTTNNGTITLTGYTGPGGAVTIPSAINGLPVTSIGNGQTSVFSANNVTNVTIPGSVTNIGNWAFDHCTSLTSVTIGTNVTSIGFGAFNVCTSLAGVTIPNSVTGIGGAAFDQCFGLTSVTIGTNVTSIGASAFVETGLTSLTIPGSVTNIGDGAFYGCASLTAIMVDTSNPAYISVAGVLFNQNQTMLIQYPARKAGTSYTITNSVTSIGDYAFESCLNFTRITIPGSVTSIGTGAFDYCTSLTAIMVDTNNPAYSSVAGVLFNQSQTLLIQYPAGKAGTSYAIPNSVTRIGEVALAYCSALTSVTIPGSVTSIGASAFFDCTGLTNITIGTSVTNIGNFAFQLCSSLTTVTIPGGVASIADYSYAFTDCGSLTGVYFQGNAPTLGPNAYVFYGDNNATVYYRPGTTGWGPTFGGRPTAYWFLTNPLILNNGPSFGFQTNRFGFIISWATNIPVVVEACTNPAHPLWSPVATNTLTGGSSYFGDAKWTNYPRRFYRVRSP
jgi:hypothetical protein